MVWIKDDEFRTALINHRKELNELREKIEKLTNLPRNEKSKENNIKNTANSDQELRIRVLENESKTINQKYLDLLEMVVKNIGNWKPEISNTASKDKTNVSDGTSKITKKLPKTQKIPDLGMDSYQILLLLDKSKANSPNFAVNSNQLKMSFDVDKTERTIRNKLLSLTKQGYVNVTGQRPKRFFITQAGSNLLSNQRAKII